MIKVTINTLKRGIESKEGKTLIGNFISLSILKLVGFALPLVTLPYLARVFGADIFGVIAYTGTIMVIIETITNWGFEYTATRDVAQQRENTDIVSRIYFQVLYSRLALTILCFVFLYLITNVIPTLKIYDLLLYYSFLYIPGNILFPSWFFQSMEKMKFITILDVLSKLIFTVLIFIIIKEQSDYIYQPLLNACGYIVSGVIAQIIIFKKFGIKFIKPDVKSCFVRVKQSTNMFVCLMLPNLYTSFSSIILKSSCGEFAIGVYSAGQRFQSIIDQLTQVLSRIFFPFLARHKEKHYIYVAISGTIAVVASLAMFFLADWFVRFFLTPEFNDAKYVMRIFAITPIFLYLINTYGTNYLVIVGKENILRNIVIVVSLLGFILTLWITPKYSYIGAALTVTIVRGIRGLLTLYYAINEKKKIVL